MFRLGIIETSSVWYYLRVNDIVGSRHSKASTDVDFRDLTPAGVGHAGPCRLDCYPDKHCGSVGPVMSLESIDRAHATPGVLTTLWEQVCE